MLQYFFNRALQNLCLMLLLSLITLAPTLGQDDSSLQQLHR